MKIEADTIVILPSGRITTGEKNYVEGDADE